MKAHINEQLIFGNGVHCKLSLIHKTLYIEVNPTQSLLSLVLIRLNYKKHQGIHLGYLKCFVSIKDELYHEIDIYKESIKNIHIVGYGFAGAVAQIISLGIYKSFLIPSSVITYDSPTPFSSTKRNEFDVSTLNQEHFVFGHDIITNFHTKLFGYAFPSEMKDYRIM